MTDNNTLISSAAAGAQPAYGVNPVTPSRGTWAPLGLGEVEITGGFWHDRQRVNATLTLPHILEWLEKEGWLPNFDRVADGTIGNSRRGREFTDSEVYKFLEAAAWEVARSQDANIEGVFRDTVARVRAAQDPDGYLNTKFGHDGQQPRWSDLEWGHELYCGGHLLQAAVARRRAHPDSDDGLFEVATRWADLVCRVFGVDGIASVCGHPEVEMALVEFGRVSGEQRYIDQASLFVDRRGHSTLANIEWGREYYQDDIPLRQAQTLRGHAVRANYLGSGATDVAVESGDKELLHAVQTQWRNAVARRTYLTGGQGSHHQDEAFGEDFELPSDRAYSETCAGIASMQLSWRLLLADPHSQYGDLIERTLYNVVATSPSADGRSFYYANTLHQRIPGQPASPNHPSVRASSSLRAPWFEVSCCPPNVARTFASLAAYLATADDAGVQIHQYAPAQVRTVLPTGIPVSFRIETDYPSTGLVRVRFAKHTGSDITVSLRVPEWVESASFVSVIAGQVTEQTVYPGYAQVTGTFHAGDTITLDLPLEARFVSPDPRIDAIRGCVAVQRGPEIYALESVDLPPGLSADDVVVDATTSPLWSGSRVVVSAASRTVAEHAWPYGANSEPAQAASFPVALIPYHDWAERGPSTMRVWIPAALPVSASRT